MYYWLAFNGGWKNLQCSTVQPSVGTYHSRAPPTCSIFLTSMSDHRERIEPLFHLLMLQLEKLRPQRRSAEVSIGIGTRAPEQFIADWAALQLASQCSLKCLIFTPLHCLARDTRPSPSDSTDEIGSRMCWGNQRWKPRKLKENDPAHRLLTV